MLSLVSAVLFCCSTGTNCTKGGDCSVKDSQQTPWLYYLAAVTIVSVFMFAFCHVCDHLKSKLV